ncbi:protein FAR-RED IMPAIRED RESPONSE 1-like [Lotus japonicus]|uniref:protein FAR-RED IMPAIRED RESPONSE 1-like n=1 Tax=Lotus japonicus TaxID=34305 RepID=UPI0025886D37|nr:protein FAR-RED IMPAIRED RESPONSE 1-like [Lotus japonicus]
MGMSFNRHLFALGKVKGQKPVLLVQSVSDLLEKDTQCECLAHLQVHVCKVDNRWHVRSFFDVHNHVLVGDKFIGLAPAHRRMSEAEITQMNNLRKADGGYQNVPFGVQAMYNEGYKEKNKDVNDARGVIGFLRKLKEKDLDIFWKHTSNDDRRLDKLFWSDGCSRMNYALFGDVLTIIFASALVSNEQEETYVWLLENFLDAMGGKVPVSVITDEDGAMWKAIKRVFPTAHHRLCAWHLLRNADLEIGEFEERWIQMVTERGCEENEWVIDLYERKEMWAAAHMRGQFFAGFRTTSRVEGLHAQVGKFVNSWNNLLDFMHNFNRYLSYQRHRELEADFASMHGDHVPQTQLKKLEWWSKCAKDEIELRGEDSGAWDPLSLCRLSALRESCRRLSKVACKTPESFRETIDLVLEQARKLEKRDVVQQPEVNMNTYNTAERYMRNPVHN